MNGLAPHTEKIFEKLSLLDCLKDYVLMGGTALALQLKHRLSEDLDFCCWHKSKYEPLKVNWYEIQQQLITIGNTKVTLIENKQCDFIVEGVRITFFADNKFKQPQNLKKIKYLNNIYLVDVETIGVLKMEVMLRRDVFRDFYDMYAILKSGISLETILLRTGKYIRHNIRTRDMISTLLNADIQIVDKKFSDLQPVYNVTFEEIKMFFTEKAKELVLRK